MRWFPAAVLSVALMSCASTGHSAPPPVQTVLRSDQTTISGNVTLARVTAGIASPLRMPLTIVVPQRGHGSLNVEAVTVGGRPATVAWDGGQPLPLSGTGLLDLGAATVDAGGTGIIWHLDGAVRLLSPGTYTAGSSVAVGHAGLAQPEDRATFVVAAGAHGQITTAGDAQIREPPRPFSLTGPGNVTLTGTMTVQTANRAFVAHQVQFGPGPFDLGLVPSGTSFTVTALLQGPVTTS